MAHDFKIGDRVVAKAGCSFAGEPATVTSVEDDWVYFRTDDGEDCGGHDYSMLEHLGSKTLKDLVVGDMVQDKYGKRKVLAVCGDLKGLSKYADNERFDGFCTLKDLEYYNSIIVQPEPNDRINLTLEDIAKLKGVSVDRIHIVDGDK